MVLIGLAFAVWTAWRLRNLKPGSYRRILIILGFAFFFSEIWKQWYLTFRLYDGNYNVWYFPFQLCSLPMYLCPLLLIPSEKFRRKVEVFLMDFTLLGGLAVFAYQEGMHYPRMILTIHSYTWHFLLVFIGCLAGFHYRTEKKEKKWKTFLDMMPLWIISVLIATVLNICLWRYGELSMFYISPFEQSTQIIFHDIAVKWGIAAGNLSYLAAMVLGAMILHRFWNRK